MRLWSLSPAYLDAKGLVALWREGLLAQKVLAGLTRGYVRHPQLDRFRHCPDPLAAIGAYLSAVRMEADRRGYHFDGSRILRDPGKDPDYPADSALPPRIPLARGQRDYEMRLLRSKLARRDPARGEALAGIEEPAVHPSFYIVAGGVEGWERVKDLEGA